MLEYFGPLGRVSRIGFFYLNMINTSIFLACILTTAILERIGINENICTLVYTLSIALPIHLLVMGTVKRLRDLGKPTSHILLACVPICNLILLYKLFCKSGTAR